jgi:benzoyl-CoA reductase subunit C
MEEIKAIRSPGQLVDFAAGLPEHAGALRQESGRRIVGTPCSWVPAEIVEAAGAVLYRIPLCTGKVSHAGVHLQSYACSYGKGLLEQALEGKLGFLDAVVFPNLCDTVQGMADIWGVCLKTIPAAGLYIPVNMQGAHAVEFLEAELQRFAERLADLLGTKIEGDRLEEAIAAWREKRRIVRSFYEKTGTAPGMIPAAEKYALLQASDLMSGEEIEEISGVLLGQKRAGTAGEGVRVFLVGSSMPFPSFFKLLDELSIGVADDYICMGRAFWGFEEGPERTGGESPYGAIARGLLSRTEGATKFRANGGAGRLLERIVRSGLRDVLWVTQKFCEPWTWQLAVAGPELEKSGCRVFHVEMAGVEGEEGALRTRLEAFAEMLRMGSEYF